MTTMTITEKILARASGHDKVEPGDNIWVRADLLMTHDVCGPATINIFKREFGDDARVFDRQKVVLTPDHYIFTADEKCHRNVDACRQFAKEQGLPYFYDPADDSYSGVCHVTLPQKGHCRPGETMFGTDSHTCTHGAFGEFATGVGNTDAAFIMGTGKLLIKVPASMKFNIKNCISEFVTAKDLILQIIGDVGVDGATYRAMEFDGDAVRAMSMEERMTVCNMAIEAGAKNGIIAPDEITHAYVKARTDEEYECFYSDEDAGYYAIYDYDARELEPVVAMPHSPSNVRKTSEVKDKAVDRAYIGSCTGGKLTDFIMAAKILKGRRVNIDTFLVPATVEVANGLREEQIEGVPLLDIFKDSGCYDPAPPSCAACLGGPADTFGRTNDAEVCISTTNRNFVGRMGSKNAEVILASPFTAAATAVTGRITDPRELMN